MTAEPYARALEWLYTTYNHRRFVHPDPLELLYAYADPADVEAAGLVAATLAYGRVRQILVSAGKVLAVLGDRPARFLHDARPSQLERLMAGFRHRFTTGAEMAALLAGIGRVRRRRGSLERCFLAGLGGEATTGAAAGALAAFAAELSGGRYGSLLSDPARRSACKRLHLYLRWMVRRDEVDPGVWCGVSPRLLVVPLDTHMLHIGRSLGLTRRRAGDLATALDLTAAFRALRPDDPVRYDFCLTRLGIHRQVHPCEFLARI